jgi:hypothetical protein
MKDQSKFDGNPLPALLPNQPGVLRTDIDTANHALTIDFDPRLISNEGVRRVAERLAPIGTSSIARRSCTSADAPRARRSKGWKRRRSRSMASGARELRFSAAL